MTNTRFFEPGVEMLDRVQLRRLQDERLRSLMVELDKNRFYREKFQDAGIELREIRGVDDIQAAPFTTKEDFVTQQSAKPPFGELLTYPLEHYKYLHVTSGTSGRPLKWLDTAESWDWWTRCWGYVYRGAGVEKGDVVFCAFSFGPYISHWTAISGAWYAGAMAVSGGGMNSEQRLRAIMDNECTVVVCTPTYALYLAEVARRVGIDLRSSAVRRTIHAGEPGASLFSVRQAIESAWGATCFDHAGATEVGAWAYPCESATESMHLNEAEFLFEVIDPKTGAELEPGIPGELVVTNFGRAGMPAVRYRTGDIVQTSASPCECGRSFVSIKGGVLGRVDDMMIIRGVNIYPAGIDDLIRAIPEVAEYEVAVRRSGGIDDLVITIEPAGDSRFDKIARALHDSFRMRFNLRVEVEKAAEGGLPRYEFKARRFKGIVGQA